MAKSENRYFFPLILFLIFCVAACNPNKNISADYTYFQRGLDSLGNVSFKEVVIQPNDMISIHVYSKTISQDQAVLFNIPNEGAGSASGYLVNTDGTIEMPMIGNVKAAGLTRNQLATTLVSKLSPFIKEPSVLIRFLQFRVNVLGQVKSPGTYNFPTERTTILDAISAAGDLTDEAQRSNVMVIREENGKRNYYPVDLRSGALFQSPVFQLQQNDLVYVGANTAKLKTLKNNPNAQRNIGLGISLISLGLLVYDLVKSN